MSRVRELNDAFRTTFEGGRVLITAGVGALPPILACEALQKVRTFTEFTPTTTLRRARHRRLRTRRSQVPLENRLLR